jgi:hypothetical protein
MTVEGLAETPSASTEKVLSPLPVWHRPALWHMDISLTENGSGSNADATNSSNS